MVEELERKLLAQSYLFDDPAAYEAGVLDALGSLRELDLLAGQDGTDQRRVSVPA
ncbi:MAG TPA: hypothetical protein VGA36_03565 [Nitriliruptorales bacterium]